MFTKEQSDEIREIVTQYLNGLCTPEQAVNAIALVVSRPA